VTNATCLETDVFSPDGSIAISVSGGTSPFSYSWSPNTGETNSTANGLSVGTYSVTVTDMNGCDEVLSATISSNKEKPKNTVQVNH
jgi:hypothetical protein